LLQQRNLVYEEINLAKDPAGRAELLAKTGMMSFPQIIIDGMVVGGFMELVAVDGRGLLRELAARAA
jgi:glutaredoxin 3